MTTVREAMVTEYGDDWQKHGPSHVFEVVNTYRTDGKDVLVIQGTGNNDVHGYDDPVSVSNYRTLYDAWSHLEGLSRGPWSNIDYIALELDSEAPEDLTDVLDSLANYPVLDEQAWSDVEQEMIREHWESYGQHDVRMAVAKAIDADELTDAAEEIIDVLVWEGILDYGCYGGGGYPSMIDSSACDFGDEDIAAWFAANIGTVVTINPGDQWYERTFDLNRENIIAS